MKKKGGYFVFRTVIILCMLAIMFSIGLYIGMSTVTAYRSDCLRQQAETIDHALALYSLAHQTVDTVRMDDKNKLQTTTKPCYPADLKTLGKLDQPGTLGKLTYLQTHFGYLSELVKFTVETSETIDPTDSGTFQYTPTNLGDDGFYSSYTLKVRLPDGYVFTSPGSNGGII